MCSIILVIFMGFVVGVAAEIGHSTIITQTFDGPNDPSNFEVEGGPEVVGV